MTSYELINMAGMFSIGVSVAVGVCAFMLPDGIRGKSGKLMLAIAIVLGLSGVLKTDSGRTVAQELLARVVYKL